MRGQSYAMHGYRDALLPSQFGRANGPMTGERNLMIAILEEAIHCYQKNLHGKNARARRLFREAEEWILGADQDAVFSFDNICRAVGLEPEYLKRGVEQWRERELQKAAGPQRPAATARSTGVVTGAFAAARRAGR